MFLCPQCAVPLVRTRGTPGVFWRCSSCDGRSATVSLLRHHMPKEVVNALWQAARTSDRAGSRRCPACTKGMIEVPADTEHGAVHVDVCRLCQFIWFDPKEYETLPRLPVEKSWEERLPQPAREKLALVEIEAMRERERGAEWGADWGEEYAWWQWIPGVLGMPVEREQQATCRVPCITWSLVLLTRTA